MRVYSVIPVNNAEMKKKKKNISGKHNSKLSSKSPCSILHIASIYPQCVIFSIQTEWGRDEKELNPNTEQRGWWDSFNCDSSQASHDAPIQYCTQVIIQIYTDSGVMYKNENGRNLRHYARVFSISRLHLSSKKLADNTKGHLKFFKIISLRGKKNKIYFL